MSRPFTAYVPGIFPRSEALVAATRDLARGRTRRDAVVELFDRERDEVVALQKDAGMDLLSEGMLRWQDIFRPLVEGSRGLEARGLVRWFDNNSFFRVPEVTGTPRLDEPAPWVSGVPDGGVATLPSPYLFSRAAAAAGDRDELMVVLAREVVAPAVEACVAGGAGLVHLQEPWLVVEGIEERSWEPLAEALGETRRAAGEAPVVLHLQFGDSAPIAERLLDLPVDAVGVDFVETDPDSLPSPWPLGLAAGCVDARRSVMETVEGTAAFVEKVAGRLEPPHLYLIPNAELEMLPAATAAHKVRTLGEVAGVVRGGGP